MVDADENVTDNVRMTRYSYRWSVIGTRYDRLDH